VFLGSSLCYVFVSYNNSAVMQSVSTVRQCGGFLARADGTGIWTQRRVVSGHKGHCALNGRFSSTVWMAEAMRFRPHDCPASMDRCFLDGLLREPLEPLLWLLAATLLDLLRFFLPWYAGGAFGMLGTRLSKLKPLSYA
jgi:hypothetical protein